MVLRSLPAVVTHLQPAMPANNNLSLSCVRSTSILIKTHKKGGDSTDIETMKVLCEPSRCRIVTLLSEKSYCVSALATLLDISVPAVSQHLKILRDAGIVYCEKYGYHTHYRLDKEKLVQIGESILELTREKPDNCRKNGFTCAAAQTVGCRMHRKDNET